MAPLVVCICISAYIEIERDFFVLFTPNAYADADRDALTTHFRFQW